MENTLIKSSLNSNLDQFSYNNTECSVDVEDKSSCNINEDVILNIVPINETNSNDAENDVKNPSSNMDLLCDKLDSVNDKELIPKMELIENTADNFVPMQIGDETFNVKMESDSKLIDDSLCSNNVHDDKNFGLSSGSKMNVMCHTFDEVDSLKDDIKYNTESVLKMELLPLVDNLYNVAPTSIKTRSDIASLKAQANQIDMNSDIMDVHKDDKVLQGHDAPINQVIKVYTYLSEVYLNNF